jgi:DNA-binding CsgD family transcriptional regulator
MIKTFLRGANRTVCRRAIVLTSPDGKVQFADNVARGWLEQFFGHSGQAKKLPRTVCRWLTLTKQARTNSSLVARRGDVLLYLKRQASYSPRTVSLLLEVIRASDKEWSRRHRDLTPREREVLSWLARGKSNPEIAAILGLKTATVGKHLERIYPKLGVENRTAAASFASEVTPDEG